MGTIRTKFQGKNGLIIIWNRGLPFRDCGNFLFFGGEEECILGAISVHCLVPVVFRGRGGWEF